MGGKDYSIERGNILKRTVAKQQKSIDRKAEKQKEARSGASAICFEAVISEGRDDQA